MPEKIAIIGGGIGGLTTAYLLNQKYDITLFEKDNRLGGNAHTHKTSNGESIDIAVAAYSKYVSRNFLKLCDKLNVKMVIRPADSLLSVHNLETKEGVYLTPLSPKGLLSQKLAMFRPKLFIDIYNAALSMFELGKLMEEGKLNGLTIKEAFSLIPKLNGITEILTMAPLCLLSSMYYEEVMNGPAEYFIGKMSAFGQFNPIPQMFGLYFPKNLTRSYVDALSSHFSDKIVLNSNIKSVARNNGSVTLKMDDGEESTFDKVVFACNADQALALLEKPTDDEKRLFGPWKYKEGLMVVHRDDSSFPKRELCQAWTCLQSTDNGTPHFSISCCCWRLCPGVSNKSEYFSTQHPNFPIKEDLIDYKKYFRTPLYDFNSFSTIKELPSLNGKMNSYYCGSHFGYGLHDDAVTSGIEVAKLLGIDWD